LRLKENIIAILALCIAFSCTQKTEHANTAENISHKENESSVKSSEPLSNNSCDYYNEGSETGIGLFILKGRLELFNDSLLTDKYCEWDFPRSENPQKPACALYYKPDYGIAHYTCLAIFPDCHKIIINGSEVKFAKGKGHFENWEKYISHSIGGIQLKHEAQFLYADADEHSDMDSLGNAALCVLEMRGEWLRVKTSCFQDDPAIDKICKEHADECDQSKTGWIRWRIGNKILIEIHQLL
jgi:hypothetical protein